MLGAHSAEMGLRIMQSMALGGAFVFESRDIGTPVVRHGISHGSEFLPPAVEACDLAAELACVDGLVEGKLLAAIGAEGMSEFSAHVSGMPNGVMALRVRFGLAHEIDAV